MTKEQAKALLSSIHGKWPTIAIKHNGRWNKDVADSWIKLSLVFVASNSIFLNIFSQSSMAPTLKNI